MLLVVRMVCNDFSALRAIKVKLSTGDSARYFFDSHMSGFTAFLKDYADLL
jgi:hypothetical protein